MRGGGGEIAITGGLAHLAAGLGYKSMFCRNVVARARCGRWGVSAFGGVGRVGKVLRTQ